MLRGDRAWQTQPSAPERRTDGKHEALAVIVDSEATIFRVAPVVAQVEHPAIDALRNAGAAIPVAVAADPEFAAVDGHAGLACQRLHQPRFGGMRRGAGAQAMRAPGERSADAFEQGDARARLDPVVRVGTGIFVARGKHADAALRTAAEIESGIQVQFDVVRHAALVKPLPIDVCSPRTDHERVVEAPLDAALETRTRIEQGNTAKDVVRRDAAIAGPVGRSDKTGAQRQHRCAAGRGQPPQTHARARPGKRLGRPGTASIMVANWSHAVPADAPPVVADAYRP